MLGMTKPIKVLKRNLAGDITWQYEGRVLQRESHVVVLEAFFNRADMPFMGLILKEKDRFIETFYSDRWYNIFEIYDRDDGGLKGWYCNIGLPAEITDGTVSYVDLALDLWVTTDGHQTILDEEEFAALDLDANRRGKALAALVELQRMFQTKRPPV